MPARQLFDIQLEPVSGSRFQPTGFPDIGAALFEAPRRRNGELRWEECLLVESAQSMANRLEGVGWDIGRQEPVDALSGLPYVRVFAGDDGRYLTSSRTESHRLASAFIKDSVHEGRSMVALLKDRLALRDDTPLAPRDIAREIAMLDPLCLLHGVFFADAAWPGQPKVARAVTGFVEANNVRPAVSGGVKRDAVQHKEVKGAGGAKESYGSIPFHRTEYVAEEVVASFVIDLDQLQSYGLGEPFAGLLADIARWEIRCLIERGLRLRTACDLVPRGNDVVDRDGNALPEEGELAHSIRRGVESCRDILGDGSPLEVTWERTRAAARAKKDVGAAPESEPA